MEFLLPDNREVTFKDLDGNLFEDVVVTSGVPEHLAPHVELDKLKALKGFRRATKKNSVWTYEVPERWYLTVIANTKTGCIALVGNVGVLQDLWVRIDDFAIQRATEQEKLSFQELKVYNKDKTNPKPQFMLAYEARRAREEKMPWAAWLRGEGDGIERIPYSHYKAMRSSRKNKKHALREKGTTAGGVGVAERQDAGIDSGVVQVDGVESDGVQLEQTDVEAVATPSIFGAIADNTGGEIIGGNEIGVDQVEDGKKVEEQKKTMRKQKKRSKGYWANKRDKKRQANAPAVEADVDVKTDEMDGNDHGGVARDATFVGAALPEFLYH
jgi:hypothetical protein